MCLGVKGTLVTIGTIVLMLIVISFSYLFSADADNHSAVEITIRDAIQQSINMGAVRVTEEITIDEEIAKEAVIRQYVATSNFNDGTLVLSVPQVNSKPASLAIESYKLIDNWYIADWLGLKEKEAKTREVNAVIYEAKETVDIQRGGNVK